MAGELSIQELIKAASELGLEGEEARNFVSEQQAFYREERQKQRELEKAKLEAERAKLEAEGKARQDDLEKERLRLQIQHLQLQVATGADGERSITVYNHASKPKLPKFDEEHDEMDAFIERYERFARSQGWKEEEWAVCLSPLLTGKGLQVYTTMPPDEASDYQKLKTALLKRYELTEEGFRRRFREAKPGTDETVVQFIARLSRYFTSWAEMSECEKSYEKLSDLLIREQFMGICTQDLALFLKERTPKTINETMKLAEQYLEAHGGSITGKPKPQPCKQKSWNSSNQVAFNHSKINGLSPKDENNASFVKERKCFKCNRIGHIARECTLHKTVSHQHHRRQTAAGVQNSKEDDLVQDRASLRNRNSSQEDAIVTVIKRNTVDGQLELANGAKIPVVLGACDNHVDLHRNLNMPVCEGYVNGKEVNVLRDSGCSSAAVRRSLVSDKQMTGQLHICTLIDGTIRMFPIARFEVNTPYYTGTLEAMCMENPIYDLIIGNIEGTPEVKCSQDAIYGEVLQQGCCEQLSAVVTRSQKKNKQDLQPLRVAKLDLPDVSRHHLIDAQRKDASLKRLWEKAQEDSELKTRGEGSYRIEVHNGVLYRIYSGRNSGEVKQILVPLVYRSQIMKLAHESIVGGHMGAKKTVDRITSSFHWPGVTADVARFCRSCDICQRTTPRGKVPKVPMGKMPLMEVPFSRVAIDLIGPLSPPSTSGNRYVLTIVDCATRYPEAVALPRIETECVAEALLEVFSRVGFPKEVLSDRGPQFTSDLMHEICRLVSTKQLFTTPYNPKCNGLCEKMNGTLKSMLRKMCQERPRDWDRYLPSVLFAYREVPQSSTGFSPFELLYGRTVRGPMQVLKELWTGEDDSTSEVRNTYQYVLDLRNRLEETCKLARENLYEAQGLQKHHYDKKAKDRRFKVNEKVLLLLPTEHNKLTLQWKGPYQIEEVINDMDYKVKMDGKSKVFHANLLKKYYDRENYQLGSVSRADEVAGAAVIDLNSEALQEDDEDLIELRPLENSESFRDVNINPNLSRKQKKQIKMVLQKYSDIFVNKAGKTNLEQHKIETTTEEPIRVKQYQMPYAMRELISNEVQEMLKDGIIEPSNAPYSAPVVMVRKKDGSNRFCIDFRKLNMVTKFDSEPMGNPDAIMTKLKGARYFSKIDFCKGYWQIPMEESSKEKTAFTTSDGCFQFVRMPFGLVNSAATFNRMMRKLIQRMEDIEHYVDDVLTHTKDWSTHLNRLEELFNRIRNAGLTIRPTKCSFGYSEVDFVGHHVGNNQIAMDQDKITKIQDAPVPVTKTQVRSFLGLAGYYRKFISNFAEKAAPLTDLTKKGRPNKIQWGPTQQQAFQNLKDSLGQFPILRMPDFKKPFIVQADASNVGIGAVLLQKHEDGAFPVMYASRKLKNSEKHYAAIEKECLALVFAVRKFQNYLYGQEFTLQTDHQPLAYIKRCKIENTRILRWAMFLQNFQFRIEAIRGKENVGADFMSRMYD